MNIDSYFDNAMGADEEHRIVSKIPTANKRTSNIGMNLA